MARDTIPSRVAVLEQIAHTTEQVLVELRADIRELRVQHRDEFRWLLGMGIAATGSLLLLGIGATGALLFAILRLPHGG